MDGVTVLAAIPLLAEAVVAELVVATMVEAVIAGFLIGGATYTGFAGDCGLAERGFLAATAAATAPL